MCVYVFIYFKKVKESEGVRLGKMTERSGMNELYLVMEEIGCMYYMVENYTLT